MFAAAVAAAPDRPLIHYFGSTLTMATVDDIAGALAAGLAIEPVERVALYLQNVPQFAIALLATWMAGGIVVPVNPMLKERELELCASGTGPGWPGATLTGDDIALLTYTSGTTGTPKGAMNTHANVVYNATAYARWMGLSPADSVLGIAPLFHITGLIGHLAVAFLVPMPVVLGYRFDPCVVLDLIERYRPTFVVAAITAFIALMNDPSAGSRRSVVVDQGVQRRGARRSERRRALPNRGRRHHPQHLRPHRDHLPLPRRAVRGGRPRGSGEWAPFGRRPPVRHRRPGRRRGLAAGACRRDRGAGDERAPGGAGLLGQAGRDGPRPAGRRAAHRGCGVHGHRRLVLPRRPQEGHDRGVGVQGVAAGGRGRPVRAPGGPRGGRRRGPDPYRGESVKAFVSLRSGYTVAPEELISWCRARLAAYKYPRAVEILEELPKTVTGKILRRELRT